MKSSSAWDGRGRHAPFWKENSHHVLELAPASVGSQGLWFRTEHRDILWGDVSGPPRARSEGTAAACLSHLPASVSPNPVASRLQHKDSTPEQCATCSLVRDPQGLQGPLAVRSASSLRWLSLSWTNLILLLSAGPSGTDGLFSVCGCCHVWGIILR